ncbi:MAG: decaprenyl-phosphate phosphoribosyltransferase, partial [Thermotaleaceae bacterium]
AYQLDRVFAAVGLGYFILIILYSFYLKNVVILDVMTIAIGFVLRAVAGAVLIGVRISPWLLLCTILLSMFLALHKRKSEMELVANGNKVSRKILEEYTPELINDMLHIVTSSTVMAYSLYTFTTDHSIYMMGTIPFVIYGIFRYQYIVHTKDMGENPELILLKDRPLIVNILLWVVSCVVILYFI